MQHTVKFRTDRVPAVDNAGLFRTNALWAHMDRVLPHDVLIFVREGLVHIIEDEIEHAISPGEVFLMKHGIRHYGLPLTLPDSEWYWITFGAPEMENNETKKVETETAAARGTSLMTGQLPQAIELKRLKVSDFQGMCVRLNKLLHHFAMGTSYDRLKLNIGTLDLLLELYRDVSDMNKKRHKLYDDVKAFVQQHLHQDIRSEQLAESLQLNYSYMSRVFSREAGMSIRRFIMEAKVKEAIRLFSESRLNISQISEKLGYNNPYYFTRIFKQVTGYSPSDYLKRGYYDKGTFQ
ncbi:helix-turn-helix domain-containing protein [Paenibacillus sp. NRS-1760]|uniref:helix-turn-helix domain-containing protein n=1 Tax=Paenibacillus sp. NRS-1760 TaxID=3233902 RepID=UPI003D2D17E2